MNKMKGTYIVAGAILGVGVGMLLDNVAAWSVIGVGLGFLADMLQNKK